MLNSRPSLMRTGHFACVIALFAVVYLIAATSAFAATRHRRHHAAEAKSTRAHHRGIAAARRRHRHAVADAPVHVRSGSDLVRTALAYRGTPYVYGGAGRGGFDCSGFTSYLYERRGISLPHSARSQFEIGKRVSRDSLKPGDLVFFHTVTPGISHVGMYIGNGRFIHASSRRSGGVRVDSLNGTYYESAFRGARRLH